MKRYNEKEEAYIIEDIFNKIILQKFEKEYDGMNKYEINNEIINNNVYQKLVNSGDLMTQIFQYLDWGKELDGDLFSCSLVNSHWLFHVWK